MTLELRWTNRALGRLNTIAAYIAKDSPHGQKLLHKSFAKKWMF